jgi:hypothetical protein
MNKDGSPRKPGSGRPKGSSSFLEVKLRDLEALFGAEDKIKVSRVWLEKKGQLVALKKCKELNREDPPGPPLSF